MLDIQITIEGDKVIIQRLQKFADRIPDAAEIGLSKIGKGIHREAYEWLSGPGAKASNVPGGGYPVPVRTGHLRRRLDWLEPGKSKTTEAETFTAGPTEIIVYDSAEYAATIHEGRGSSAKFGPRRYITDALEIFNRGARIKKIVEKEIQKEIDKNIKS